MASSYTTSLKIQQIGNGEQSGSWGNTTNTNWTLIEQAVAGVQTITMSNSNYTLTNLNGVLDEARNAVLVLNGTNSGIYQIITPLVVKVYIVSNQTTGGYAVTIGGSSGSLISVPNGTTTIVYCDGTNFYSGLTGLTGNQTISGNLSVTGNETVGGTLGVTGAVTGASFTGAGTGLTGTAASLSIGGNAATATIATNATNITNSGGWSVTPSGTKLYFNYNGTNVASLDSSGNFITLGNNTAVSHVSTATPTP